MGILIDKDTRVLVQGITGVQGNFHSQLMQRQGTLIVAGTSPGKGGSTVNGIAVYDTIKEAQKKHEIDASIIFVPAPQAAKAGHEALKSGIKTVVIITEHIPIKDTIGIMVHAKEVGAVVVGPNTPGILSPKRCLLGIMPPQAFTLGEVGIMSRSGTLTYEIATALTRSGVGQSTCVGVGGDPVSGLNFIDVLKLFKDDVQTKAVVLIGEIGGNVEEQTAHYIATQKYPKPVVAYIAGRTAPIGKRMGHAGAMITGKAGTAQTKVASLEATGVKVAQRPSDVPVLVAEVTGL